MFKRTRISAAAIVAVSGLVAATGSQAQQTLERVEITGSAIKRIANEGALPVTTVTRSEIEKSGATSVAEVIQKLPSMQGFTTTSESVNGGGAGTATASLHSLGNRYTLVLLNGRRLAPFDTGTVVNLENIPISAIERVEVLTDGASALYGSDAIGGVVNFILRKDRTDGAIELKADKPEEKGGATRSFGITKGFGDLSSNGFNVLMSYSHDEQKELKAADRSFAKSGIIKFLDGQPVGLRLFSSNTVPATVLLLQKPVNPLTDDGFRAFYTPYLLTNGSCPELHVVNGQTCRFDFSSQVQLIPETKRDTLLTSGRLNLSPNHQLFGEAILSKFVSKPRYAPAAQPGLFMSQAQFDKYVTPFLGTLGLTPADVEPVRAAGGDPNFAPTYNVRVFDAGGRQDEYTYKAQHFVVGAEGNFGAWDYTGSLTHSVNKWTDKAIGGYLSAIRFQQAIDSGAYDPLGSVAGASVAGLKPAVLNEELENKKSTLDVLTFRSSGSLFQVGGRDASLAVGVEGISQRFVDNPAPISQGQNKLQPNFTDSIIGGGGGALPFDTTRVSAGTFAEMLLPLAPTFDLTGAVRYDRFSAADNSRNFDELGNPIGSAKQGKASNSATYKISGRFQPSKDTLFRGSYGTGFKAPNLLEITQPLQAFGVTSSSFDCPFKPGDALATGCRPPDSQYNVLQGGNASTGSDALKPEKSKQWTLGFRVEPTNSFSFGADLWDVTIKDRIESVPEDVAFADPTTYRSLFTIANDPVTGAPQLTFIDRPLNLGTAKYRGLDLDMAGSTNMLDGRLTVGISATYMIKAKYQVPGLADYQSDLGQFGTDQKVVFRWLAKFVASLQKDDWTHTVSANYKSGYTDHKATCSIDIVANPGCADADGNTFWVGPEIRNVNATTGAFGSRIEYTRRVREYITFDWQTKYQWNKAISLTFGIRNLFDEEPPLSIQDAGGGNMRGFDGRYADPIGRTYYLNAAYKF